MNPRDCADLFTAIFEMDSQAEEIMTMITLNTKHQPIGAWEVSRGHLSGTLIHPREAFKRAIMQNAAALIMAHNHPSGDPLPSDDDLAVTKRLVEAGSILGIQVLDHVIIGDGSRYYSFREHGRI